MTALAIVVAKFHEHITDQMLEQARQTAHALDATLVEVIEVPGSYDTVLAADRLARRSDIDAVAVLGAIITGDTDHDQIIGHAIANQLLEVQRERDTPVTLGITGPGMTAQEATDRIEAGSDAVHAAVELVDALYDQS